jgi:hypothetical protein
MDPTMSDDVSFANLGPGLGADDGLSVRFPPGLGLIPPRELVRQPRPRARGAPGVPA